MRLKQIRPTIQVETLEARRLLSAGALDTSFNGTGKVSLSNIPHFNINGVATQSTGQTIVVGEFTTGLNIVCLERLNVNGSVDTTFGTDGTGIVRLTNLNGSPEDVSVDAAAIAVQAADDKIVFVGTMHVSGGDFGYVARLNANGTVDTGFGQYSGYSVLSTYDSGDSAENFANAVALQQDGKIIVAGGAKRDSSFDYNFAAGRFNSNGTLDTSFDGNGLNDFQVGTSDIAEEIAIDYSGTASTNSNYGKIVLAGTEAYNSAFAVARLNTNGSLDSSFSGDGKLTSTFGSQFVGTICSGAVVQSTGKIVIEGDVYPSSNSTVPEVGLFRLNANGLGDSTFGTSNGQAIVAFPSGTNAAGLINGQADRLIVGGNSAGDITRVACLSIDGVIDPYFGSSGFLTINFQSSDGNSFDDASDFTLETGGTIVAVGGGDGVARFFDRKAETVSIGTFQPIMYEQGPTGTTFFVTRLERLSTAERVYLTVSGTATAPGNIGRRPIDYTGTNITFPTGGFGSTYVDIPANQTFTTVTITPVDDTLVEGDETAIFTVAPSTSTDYDAVTPTSTTLTIRDNDIAAGPSVRSSAFNYDAGPPQSVSYSFDQDVSSSIGASDFSVTGPSGTVPFTLAYDNVNDLATLNFSSILPNGNYTATALAAGITNSAGTKMASNSSLSFFFLNGDANHDGKVDVADLGILATNYGGSGKTFSQGDFNYDGKIDVADLGILATNYGLSITPSSLPAAQSFSPQTPATETTLRHSTRIADDILD